MSPNPVTQTIRIVLTILFLFWLLLFAREGRTEEFAVPNSGSPYLNLGDLHTGQILHLPTGLTVTFDQMLDSINPSRVIYVGETHDNIEAHKVQLKIIKRLSEKHPVAIGLEMFRRSSQEKLDLWNSGQLSKSEFKTLFHTNWGTGYRLYQPIFDFARAKNLPLIGLKSSQNVENSFRSGDPAPNGTFYPELDDQDPYHRAFSMAAFGGHRGTEKALEKPYRMLLLWEETMAQTVSQFLMNPKYKNTKLVVLSGGFHVQYGFGIPKRAYRRVPHAYSIIQPTVTHIPEELKNREMEVEKVSIPLFAADYAWKVDYKVPDNVRLGVRLAKKNAGVTIMEVMENTNAERAGILKGDLLLSMDGKNISRVEEVLEQLQSKSFDDHSIFRIQRNGKEQKVEVVFIK
ncbi:MAG: PDZ domain-containing protein [Nitrospinae bacterium]|nr:PDZ domain-containing protein [Nitrospinota bacterium]MZH14592.1 PDZ domain-containing protein [Nitrospinota bacterium]